MAKFEDAPNVGKKFQINGKHSPQNVYEFEQDGSLKKVDQIPEISDTETAMGKTELGHEVHVQILKK